MAALFAGLASIGYTLLVKLIGYEFISRTLVIALTEWSKSTDTKWDDEVTQAAAKAWGVHPDFLK